MRNVWIGTLVAVLLAAGCATTPEKLRAHQTRQLIVVVPGSYQQVYRHLLGQARTCSWYDSGVTAFGGSTARVENALFSDLNCAEIALTWHGTAGTDTPFLLDIEPAGAGQTRVTAYFGYSGLYRGKVRKWLAELAGR